MSRRAPKVDPKVLAGQPKGAGPTELRGRNERGAVRPADARYLEDEEQDRIDAYVLEETGPEAQQLVAKRQALRVLLEQLDDEQLAGIFDVSYSAVTTAMLDRLEASATEMPRTTYRELLETLQAAIDEPKEQEA